MTTQKYKSLGQMVKAVDYEALKNYFDSADENALKQLNEVNEKGRKNIDLLLQASIVAKGERQLDIVDLLLKQGADINMADKNGMTLLMAAAAENNVESLNFLINHPDVDVVKLDEIFKKATHYAVLNNAVDAFTILFNTGKFDINEKTSLREETYLHMAAQEGHVEMCEKLMELGIDPTIEEALEGSLAASFVPEGQDIDGQPHPDAEKYNMLFEKLEDYREGFKKNTNSFDF